jgi:UDP-N-acetylmuramate--alanine ligase
MIELRKNMKLHFTGIGGAGMLPLAVHAATMGFRITGSDLSGENFHILEKAGIHPQKGHGSVSPDTGLVVYSAAVAADNPELISAKTQNIPAIKRAEFLDMVTRDRHSVLVSGSHGKSTVTAMLADMMSGDEFKAAAIVGAETVAAGSNYYPGTGDHIVIEADEYDRSFLRLHPTDLIILNIDDDHMDIYGDITGLKAAFSELASRLKNGSFLVYNADDINTAETVAECGSKKIGFGMKMKSDYTAQNIKFEDFNTSFDLIGRGKIICTVRYIYSGMYNVYNMLAAAALLSEYGISGKKIAELALRFKGVKRRMEIIFRNENFILIDDYGHHPSEIRSSLENVRDNAGGRIIVLFQPHLFSRTKYHLQGFADSFRNADLVLISQIYPAREKYDPSVASSDIFCHMDEAGKEKTKVFDNFESLYRELEKTALPGDVIVSMGAGEINKVLYKFKKAVEKNDRR